jgi:hypothetical protein
MKRSVCIVWFVLAASPRVFAEAPAPTRLEALAADPQVINVVDRDVGGLDSADAFVSVAVVSLEDRARSPNRMHGVRFELRNSTGVDHVYLDESQLKLLRTEVELIDKTWPQTQRQSGRALTPGGTLMQGTTSCWMPHPALRILCPAYRAGPDWSGLTLRAYGGPPFAFPNRRASDLLELVDRALSELAATQ